jgi:hypothetical protein
MKLLNLTPHAIRLIGPDGSAREIPPSGNVARVAQTLAPAGDADGVPLFRAQFGPVVGLPEPEPGVLYIVSALVRTACPDRTDLASPGDLVRGPDGQPVGCRGLIVS